MGDFRVQKILLFWFFDFDSTFHIISGNLLDFPWKMGLNFIRNEFTDITIQRIQRKFLLPYSLLSKIINFEDNIFAKLDWMIQNMNDDFLTYLKNFSTNEQKFIDFPIWYWSYHTIPNWFNWKMWKLLDGDFQKCFGNQEKRGFEDHLIFSDWWI